MDNDQHAAAWQRIGSVASTAGLTLASACQACTDDLRADFGGATLVTDGALRLLAAATDARARAVEDAQLVTGEGPCTDAYTRRAPVEVADLGRATGRWPAFAPLAVAHGGRGVLALPLTLGILAFGAVDLYRCAPVPFTRDEKARATAYARILAMLALEEHPHLLAAPPARSVRPGPQGYPPAVHMAAGVLAAAYDISPDDALARLRAHSFRHNQPLLRTAEHVLDHQRLD
ncbi:ANTAR domain-containing protein [Streptomyces longispororuber]|uniref:ANTAR domain-containing protein n=1 Tax=Streptomyces longispororuber TaxID=68230 RepID=UPI0037009747